MITQPTRYKRTDRLCPENTRIRSMQRGKETLGIVSPMVRIGQLGRLEQSVEGVMRQIALRAAGSLADQTHRLEFVEQVLRGFVDVQHPVDRLAGCVLTGGHDRDVLLTQREVVCDANADRKSTRLNSSH